ncbi:MAG: hypothetical protein ACXVIY_01965, partial [Mucilaginibacter sp.]
PTNPRIAPVVPDTIPDMAAFKLKLVKDQVNNDETMFLFSKTSSLNYDPNEDARYFAGNGDEHLSSISADGWELVINTLPYKPGMSVGLDVQAKTDGKYSLSISYQKAIPQQVHIWLKDMYLKDSVDVRTTSYNFDVAKSDTNSFGSNRFKLIIKGSGK